MALRGSQQPSPLVSFGENILDQYQTQLFLQTTDAIGAGTNAWDFNPYLVYGIRNDLAVTISVPFAVINKVPGSHSSGIMDTSIQVEYAFFNTNHLCSYDQATLVAAVYFPSGSTKKVPNTGFGSYSYFIGPTFNHTGRKWFYFTSYGALITTTHHRLRYGNQYVYQFGFGRNIYNPPGWILAWMVEFDGTFAEHNKINGKKDPNSGGNVILVTPSFWASTDKLTLQFGVGFVPIENLFGNQPRQNFLIAFNFAWTW